MSRAAAALLIVLAAVESRAASPCGPLVSHHGDSWEVSPGGTDDSASIQCALQRADGGTVRLTAGTFHVAQVVARGFRGKLVGQGHDATTVVNVDRPIFVTPVDWNDGPPSAANPWPSLFNFVDGRFTVSDMTIEVRGTDPTTGWSAFGVHLTALAHAISITGERADATIERVVFRG